MVNTIPISEIILNILIYGSWYLTTISLLPLSKSIHMKLSRQVLLLTILKFIKNYSYEMYLLHMKVMLILNTNKPVRVLEIMVFLSMLFFLSIIFSKLCNIINKIYFKIFN